MDDAIVSRRSVRAFLPEEISRETVEDILSVASRAPSGNNSQPWQVYVLTGESRASLIQALLQAYDDPDQTKYVGEYSYYPEKWISPFLDRRRKVGWDLYSLLGITREDKVGMHRQTRKNYEFFGAPVALLFTINRIMSVGSWLDYGMFIQSVMIAARARGLDTCPQAAFVPYGAVIARELALPSEEMLVCGMALGRADETAIENSLRSERAPVSEFARFLS